MKKRFWNQKSILLGVTFIVFPEIGLKFLANRDNPDAFEPAPTGKESDAVTNDAGEEVYTVTVDGQSYTVAVADGGDVTGIAPVGGASTPAAAASGAVPMGGETGVRRGSTAVGTGCAVGRAGFAVGPRGRRSRAL